MTLYVSRRDPATGEPIEATPCPPLPQEPHPVEEHKQHATGCVKCGYDVTVKHNGQDMCGWCMDKEIEIAEHNLKVQRIAARRMREKTRSQERCAVKRENLIRELSMLPVADCIKPGHHGKPTIYHVWTNGRESPVDYRWSGWYGKLRWEKHTVGEIVAKVECGTPLLSSETKWRRVILTPIKD